MNGRILSQSKRAIRERNHFKLNPEAWEKRKTYLRDCGKEKRAFERESRDAKQSDMHTGM